MSQGMKTALLWAAVILTISYLGNISIGGFIGSVLHAAQTVHNSNVHP